MPETTKEYAVALGTFDGLHLAHLEVLNSAVESGFAPACVCFSTPPKSNEVLITTASKAQRLESMGFEHIKLLNFKDVKNISPTLFLDMLFGELNIKQISCGFNYRFGQGAAGDIRTLEDYCKKAGAHLVITPKVEYGGQTVSSSRIRELIKNGEVHEANKMLSEPFGFSSPVISGDHRGRTINFPTINQELPGALVTPKFGVYASLVYVDECEYKAVTNIGIRPTYRLETPLAETFIIGFEGNLYGKEVCLKLKKFLRPEKKFGSLEELQAAIENDKQTTINLNL